MNVPGIDRYEEVRPHLNTGDLILFSGTGFISRAIQFLTRSPWSHIGMIIDLEGYDMVLLWESTTLSKITDLMTKRKTNGVQIVSMSERMKCYNGAIAVRHLYADRSAEELSKVIELRNELRGKPYETNKLQLIRSVFSLLNNRKENLDSVFCSEMIAEAYQRAGWMSNDEPANSFAPERFSSDSSRPIKLTSKATLSREIVIKQG